MRHSSKAALIAAFCLVSAIAVWSAHSFVTPGPAKAHLLNRYIWALPDPWFGGFSGFELSHDGKSFHAVTDRGRIVTGQITRSDGRIRDISVTSTNPLKNDAGGDVTGNLNDSEGLALLPNGRIVVSFEFVQRIWLYDSPLDKAHWASYSKAWRAFATNIGFEALAVDDTGTVFAIPEGGRKTAPVFRWRHGEKWQQPFLYTLRGSFRPVGADFGPDGKLYVLERAVSPFGFRSRIRQFDVTRTGFENDVVVFTSLPGKHDNLEGIALWQDDQNRIRITMISDDNFRVFQRTEVVDYVLQE